MKTAFKKLAFAFHPDHGGDAEMFHRLMKARDQARLELAR